MNIAQRGMMAGAFAMGLLLSGCTDTAEQDEATGAPLVVYGATMTTEIAPLMLAMRDLYPEGNAVQLGGVKNLADPENRADVASNAETQLLRYSVADPSMRIIMTIVEGDYSIIARKSAGINSLADLKGKRIATLRNTSADYFISKMLESEGMTQDDVTVMEIMPLEDMPGAMTAHDIDAVAIWEPFSENVVRALGDDAVELSGEGIYSEHYNLNTTASALADPVQRKEIIALMQAIIAATKKMNEDPSEAHALVAESGGYTVEEVAHSWPRHTFYAGFADDMLDVLVDEEKWLAAIEERPARTREELAPLIDRSAYDEAVAAAQ